MWILLFLVQKLGIPIMQNLIHAVIWIRIAKIELYGVPVYYVYIKGTDDKGQSVKYTWKALRFMPYYNPPNFSSYKTIGWLIVACISSIGSLHQNIKKPMRYIIHILNIMVQ